MLWAITRRKPSIRCFKALFKTSSMIRGLHSDRTILISQAPSVLLAEQVGLPDRSLSKPEATSRLTMVSEAAYLQLLTRFKRSLMEMVGCCWLN